MWTMALTLLQKPTVIAIMLLTMACGTLYVNNTLQDAKILKLESQVVVIESNYNTCVDNETTLKGIIEESNSVVDGFVSSNNAIKSQLIKTQQLVVYWQNQYDNKVCYTNNDETPVIPTQGKVVNDETSADAVTHINDLFAD